MNWHILALTAALILIAVIHVAREILSTPIDWELRQSE